MSVNTLSKRPPSLLARVKHDTRQLLAFPARLVARLRGTPPPRVWPGAHPGGIVDPVSLPGPWAFLTSGYLAGLVVTAFLLHRIQNIVVPPRRTHPSSLHRAPTALHLLSRAVFPLDLSSSLTRLALRLPTLYFLARALTAWLVALVQTAHRFPLQASPWLLHLGRSVACQDMATLCWSTFLTVCATLCVEALMRGLEGGNTTGSPFNLFGYAFSLHIYSSPAAHGNRFDGLPSRPDVHVLFTIILPLLQLTMAHGIGVKQRWAHHRLIPSATVSLLGLVHFHFVLWFSTSSYPLLNYMPCLFETLLLSSILLAASLNTLTQLITQGVVTRPLFGHREALRPKWDEDFSLVLLRIGTASLETSAVSGLGNQVGSVAALSPGDDDTSAHGTLELGRFGVSSISPAMERRRGARRRVRKRGLSNDIRSVKPVSGETDLWFDMAWCREVARFCVGVVRWVKFLCRSCWDVVRGRRRPSVLAGDDEMTATTTATMTAMTMTTTTERRSDDVEQDVYARFVRGEQVSDDEQDEFDPTERCTSQSSVCSSDEDDNEDSADVDLDPDVDANADGRGEADADVLETVSLYADLTSSSSSLSVSVPSTASLLLAHMVDRSTFPLTRRRFEGLVSGMGWSGSGSGLGPEEERGRSVDERTGYKPSGSMEALGALGALGSSGGGGGDGQDTSSRSNCVVCMTEPRQIICWPCRCLTLCDDCRENLASRSSASRHTCPCCRRSVEGYSKIYVP